MPRKKNQTLEELEGLDPIEKERLLKRKSNSTNDRLWSLDEKTKYLQKNPDLSEDNLNMLITKIDGSLVGILGYTLDELNALGASKDYILKLREKVCAYCMNQDHGQCVVRDMAECTLNCYFELVVEAMEEVKNKTS